MSDADLRQGLLRALCFHDAWGYAPTLLELVASWDAGRTFLKPSRESIYTFLLNAPPGECAWSIRHGRVVLSGREALIDEHERRTLFFPRKLRAARRVAAWLARLGGVRFAAVCNTTALAHARDEGDLDFFIVTKAGSLWQTRGWAALPFKLMGRRPHDTIDERDAVCLSFFIDDTVLDTSLLQLTPDDPYFRHWFLSLLPLVDDGLGERLWQANSSITARHPLSPCWKAHPECSVEAPSYRWPTCASLESYARAWQMRVLPPAMKAEANQSTHVVVNDHVLKLHMTDNRAKYRQDYAERCRIYGVEP